MESLFHTPPLTNPSRNAIDAMVDEVADMIGGSADVEAREKALRMLDRAASRMNAAGLYFFRRKEASFSSLTLGQSTLDLSTITDWGWPADPAGCYDVGGNLISVIEWKPWELFRNHISTAQAQNSVAEYAAIKNEIEQLAYLSPPIDTSKVSSIKLTYFARVIRPSEATDNNLYVSDEAREALITGAQTLLIRERHITKPNVWQPMMADFMNCIEQAKNAAARHQAAEHIAVRPDEAGYLYPVVVNPGARPTVYMGF